MSIRVNHIRDTTANLEALITPQVAEVGYDVTKKELHFGDGATLGGIRLSKKNISEIVVAAQIVANSNDYNPAGLKHAGALHISTDAARDITGLVPATVTDTTDGREITIYNAGGFNATLKDQHVGSAAANRFDLNGSDIVLAPKTSATLRYRSQGGFNRWELKAQTVGAAVGAGAVIARTLAASSQGLSLINGAVACSVAGGALTIAIKTLAGNDPSAADPVLAVIRNATLATGDYSVAALTAATSLVISSGSSLGAVNGAAFALRLVGINDAGTFRLGAINLGRGGATLPLLRTDQLVSSTAEGGAGAADNVNTLYTGAAVANKPFTMIADLDWSAGLVAAGTWDAAPTQIQLYDARRDLPGHGMQAIAKKFTGLFGGKIVESRAGNAATYAIKALSGNDPSVTEPVYATFQDGAGGLVVRTITAALSVTISSGSTLGFSSAEASRVWIVLIDTGSTAVVGVVNCRSGTDVMSLLDGVTYTTTAEGGAGAADNAQVIYSVAAQAAKYLCIAGYADYDAGLVAAGTWASAPTRISLFGPGTPRPGAPTGNIASVSTGAYASGSTTIPHDNTIPQSTEGVQFISKSITPQCACNLLQVETRAVLWHDASARVMAALFRDSAVDALAAVVGIVNLTNAYSGLSLSRRVLASALASTSFKVRGGSDTAGNISFNGLGGANFGGAMNSFLEVREIMG